MIERQSVYRVCRHKIAIESPYDAGGYGCKTHSPRGIINQQMREEILWQSHGLDKIVDLF